MQKYNSFRSMGEENGRLKSVKLTMEYAPFTKWIHDQRAPYSSGTIDAGRKSLLEDIGLEWTPNY